LECMIASLFVVFMHSRRQGVFIDALVVND
jgi:hypothetical protein